MKNNSHIIFGAHAKSWGYLFILLAMYVLAILDRYILNVLINPIRSDIGIGDFEFSILQGAAFIVLYSVVGLPMGYLADTWSRRCLVFIGIMVWSFGVFVCGMANSYAAFVAGRGLIGVGEAALVPVAYGVISDCFPKTRMTLALSIFSCGPYAGSAIALPLGGHFAAMDSHVLIDLFGMLQIAPWRAAFVVAAIPGFGIAFLSFLLPKGRKRQLEKDKADAGGVALRDWLHANRLVIILLFASFGCINMLAQVANAWAPAFINRSFAWSMAEIGMILGVIYPLAGLAGKLSIGLIVDHLQGRGWRAAALNFYIPAGAALAVFGVATFTASNPYLFLVLWPIVIVLASHTGVSASAVMMITPVQFRGRIAAAYLIALNLTGMGIGPSAVAFLTDFVFADDKKVGWSLAVIFAVAGIIATALLLLARKAYMTAVARDD